MSFQTTPGFLKGSWASDLEESEREKSKRERRQRGEGERGRIGGGKGRR